MAKNNNPEETPMIEETVSIVNVSSSELARFMNYLNPYDLVEFREAMPEWIQGKSLIGNLIAIHEFKIEKSWQLQAEFYKAEIEIAGYEGRFTTTFFSVPAKTVLNILLSVGVPLPVFFYVKGQGSTYTLANPSEFVNKK